MADPQVKFFFLVAGFEYSKTKNLDFYSMCTGRVRERIAFINRTHTPPDSLVAGDTILRFLRFRPGTGQIQVIDRKFVTGKGIKGTFPQETDWKPLSSVGSGDRFDPATFVSAGPFRAINKSTDYTNKTEEYWTFVQGPAASDVMSIVDVYKSVRGAPLGSVLELSTFSHGWIEGPVLVNSSNHSTTPGLRDPQDKDGRSRLDFTPSMGESAALADQLNIVQFMTSFDPKGVMRTWGCSFDIELRVIQQTQTQIRRGGVTDSTVINFHFEDWAPERYTTVDPGATFLPSSPAQTDIARTFGEVKKFLRMRLGLSYAMQFATRSNGITAFGALPGTEGDDEKTGYRMQKVCAKFDPPECPVSFGSLFDFYSKHLGIKVDGRGYGIFDPVTTQKLAAQIAADGP